MTIEDSTAPSLGCWVTPDPSGAEGEWFVAITVDPVEDEAEPRRRPPVDLMLVVDRSSSMVGARIAAAVEAARRICLRLDENDRVGVVAFDSAVQTVRHPGAATATTATEVAVALTALGVGYGTNVSAGWKRAADLITRGGIPGAAKTVLLLTDGLPSRGIRKSGELEMLVAEGVERGIVTSTVGIGDRFDEKLLSKMAIAGGGNYRFAERDEDTTAVADEEVAGLMGLVAESAVLHIGFAQAVKRYEVVHELPCRVDGDGLAVNLGRLFIGRPRTAMLHLAVESGTRHLGAVGLSCVGANEAWNEAGPARMLLPAPGQEQNDAQQVGAIYVPLRVARWQQKIWECGRDSSVRRLQQVMTSAKVELEAIPEAMREGDEASEALARFDAGCERILSAIGGDEPDHERRRRTEAAFKTMTEESTQTIMGVTRVGLSPSKRRRRGWGKR